MSNLKLGLMMETIKVDSNGKIIKQRNPIRKQSKYSFKASDKSFKVIQSNLSHLFRKRPKKSPKAHDLSKYPFDSLDVTSGTREFQTQDFRDSNFQTPKYSKNTQNQQKSKMSPKGLHSLNP